MTRAESTQKAERKTGEYNALQDWMCSVGEPASSLIVSIALSALVVITALLLKTLF